jgi:hypothetical protein
MRNKFLAKIFNSKKLNIGKVDSSLLYIIVIMASITGFSFLLMGGVFPDPPAATTKAPEGIENQEIVFEQDKDPGKRNLQLQTFTVKNTEKACEDKIAVDFLIDVSGSMAFGNKRINQRNALNNFVSRMKDNSVIGIQIFSDPNNVREVVPISLYKNVKTQVQNTINTLPANGATSTRSAFELARQKLLDAINQKKFPGYSYNLVFLSDGIPEVAGIIHNSDNCLVIAPDSRLGGTRCFAKAQDPRSPTDIPQIIKTQGVDIYSIAITDPGDQPMKNELLRLLQDVSSDPDSTYFYESVDGNDLTTILERIFTSICDNG